MKDRPNAANVARLHSFGYRFGIVEVVLLSLAIGEDIFGRHQLGIVTKRCEFTALLMCADAAFRAVRQGGILANLRLPLATRPLLPQCDGAARTLPTSGTSSCRYRADNGDRGIGYLNMECSLSSAPPCQLRLLAGPDAAGPAAY